MNFAWQNRSTDCILFYFICTTKLNNRPPLYENERKKNVDNILLWQTVTLYMYKYMFHSFIHSFSSFFYERLPLVVRWSAVNPVKTEIRMNGKQQEIYSSTRKMKKKA